MQHKQNRAPARVVALSVAVCLAAGCAHTAQQAKRAGGKSGRAWVLGAAPPALTLDAAQERRAEALAHYGAGVSMEISGDRDGALEEYQKSLELDPEHSQLAVRLATIAMGRKQFDKAVSMLESAAKANPSSPEPWYGLGLAYRAGDQIQKAITAFRQTVKLDPTHLGAIRALREIYLQQDSLADAANVLEQAWRQQSTDASYWMRLGDEYVAALRQKPTLGKNVERTRIQQCYEKALALEPADPDVIVRLADVHAEAGKFQLAADFYAKLVELQPNALGVRERLADAYIQVGAKDKAASVLEEIIRREPLRYTVYNALGELYEDLNQDDRAVSNYQQSLVVNPNQPDNYVHITGLQLQLKRIDNALQTLTTWKEKFPADYRAPYYNGLIHTEKKQYGEAIASFADAESLALQAPQEVKLNDKFYFSYGAASERAGEIDKAITLFRKALELNSENSAAANYLGYMWADKNIHLEDAYDLIKKATTLEPDNGAYLDSFGWVLFRMGRYEDALTQLKRAAELMKEPDPVVFEHLADVLLKLGRDDEALTNLRRAHELDPSNKAISEKIEKLSGKQSAAH
jgi:tetratricopeptide (TPR) repeat protein